MALCTLHFADISTRLVQTCKPEQSQRCSGRLTAWLGGELKVELEII